VESKQRFSAKGGKMQYADQPFYTKYPVKPGDNLFKIANSRGFDNPGPIIAYPPNRALFQKQFGSVFLQVSRDFRLMPGDILYIPWHPNTLLKTIATSEHLVEELKKDTALLLQQQIHTKEAMNSLLFKIDAANFLANIATGIGGLARNYAKEYELGEEAVLEWFMDYRIGTIGSNITTMAVPAPSVPKRDIKFFIRHTLGPWNPSFWVSVVAAIKEGDIDYYLYGHEAVMDKNAYKIQQQALRDIQQLQNRVTAARQQLHAPFYQHRI
jgi:hypothetical protein